MASSIETGATFSPVLEKYKRFLGDFSHEPEQRYYIVFNMSQRSTRCDWIENWKPTSRCNNQLLDSPANVEESILIHSTKIPCKKSKCSQKGNKSASNKQYSEKVHLRIKSHLNEPSRLHQLIPWCPFRPKGNQDRSSMLVNEQVGLAV